MLPHLTVVLYSTSLGYVTEVKFGSIPEILNVDKYLRYLFLPLDGSICIIN